MEDKKLASSASVYSASGALKDPADRPGAFRRIKSVLQRRRHKPRASIVVIAYSMARALPRTLASFRADYQRDVEPADYEVIVVDNGSPAPVDEPMVKSFGANFRLLRIEEASPSPAGAANRGIAEARADIVGVMIDGARLVTPGLIHAALHGATLYQSAVVAALGWYLGFDLQGRAQAYGYSETEEDALLASIGWPSNGYRLFEIGTPDESSLDGWTMPINESNAIFMRRALWHVLGGFDERFDEPGGGLVNLDLFERAASLPDAELVLLLGEATFHQFHGGTSTNAPLDAQEGNWLRWSGQYEKLRGRRYVAPTAKRTYLGRLPEPAARRFARALTAPSYPLSPAAPFGVQAVHPLGAGFDPLHWRCEDEIAAATASDSRSDEVLRSLVSRAHAAFASGSGATAREIATLAIQRGPFHAEARRILSLTAQDPMPSDPPALACHLASLGEALVVVGDEANARIHFHAALEQDKDCTQARLALAHIDLWGPDYLWWLNRLHAAIEPRTYVEIGVFQGSSLALAQPPTQAFGIDPNPSLTVSPKTTTMLLTETSDAVFQNGALLRALDGSSIDLGFVDGLHNFEQVVRDVTNLERLASRHGVIAIHDTLPQDELTQRGPPVTRFHSGDVWKIVPFLSTFRPDLRVITIKTPPTGLTLVTHLNPDFDWSSITQADVARFQALTYSWLMEDRDRRLSLVPNNWDTVRDIAM